MRFRLLLSCLICATFAASAAFAQTKTAPNALGTFGGWKAYSYTDKSQPVCYMALALHPAPNKKLKRGAGWLMITHRPGEGSKDVVSFTSGYSFKPSTEAKIIIDKTGFSLFTQTETAWSRDTSTDHALAAAIRNGESMKITGTPAAKGTKPVTDAISLKGSEAAYAAIGKACGYPEEKKPTAKKPVAAKPLPAAKKH